MNSFHKSNPEWYKMNIWKNYSPDCDLNSERQSSDSYRTYAPELTSSESKDQDFFRKKSSPPMYENDVAYLKKTTQVYKNEPHQNAVSKYNRDQEQVIDEREHMKRKNISPSNSSTINQVSKSAFSQNEFSHENTKHVNQVSSEKLFSPSRDSVTSDPEIYAKSSASSEKLQVQINKLKTEMVALRSNTVRFQHTMEKVLDDLRWMKLLQQSGNQLWLSNSDYVIEASGSPFSDEGKFAFKRRQSLPGRKIAMGLQEIKKPFNSTENGHNYHTIQTYDSNNETAQKNEIPTELHSTNSVLTRQTHQELLTKPNDANPNSSESSSTSLDVVESCISSLSPTALKVGTVNKEKPIQCLTIQENTKLRISKCSIDSGYQDSSVVANHDKLTRNSQPNTTLSPTSFEHGDLASSQTIPKLSVGTSTSHTIPNLYVNLKKADVKKIPLRENQEGTKQIYTKPEPIVDPNLKDRKEEPPSSPDSNNLQANNIDMINESNVFTPLQFANNKNEFSSVNELNTELIRPVPKQRTLYLSQPHLNKTKVETDNITSSTSYGFKSTVSDKSNRIDSSKKTEFEEFLSTKPNQSNAVTNSHLTICHPQTRDIRTTTTSSINAPFKPTWQFCSPWDSKLPDNVVRRRVISEYKSTGNCKQLLEEKCYLSKNEMILEEKKSNTSIVKRRSMRLMQEFQVFDFKEVPLPTDGSQSSSNSDSDNTEVDSICRPCDSEPETAMSSGYFVAPPVAVKLSHFEKGPDWSEADATAFENKSFSPNDNFSNYENFNSSSQPFLASKLAEEKICLSSSASNKPSQLPELFSTHSYPVLSERNSFPSNPSEISSEINFKKFVGQNAVNNGLKINPHFKSAFKPVLSSNIDLSQRMTSKTGSQTKPRILFRQTSLPSTVMSNKQRYLNEFGINSSNAKHGNRDSQIMFPNRNATQQNNFIHFNESNDTTKSTGHALDSPQTLKPTSQVVSTCAPTVANVRSSHYRSVVDGGNGFVTSSRANRHPTCSELSSTAETLLWKTRTLNSRNNKEYLTWSAPQHRVNDAKNQPRNLMSTSSIRSEDRISYPHSYETVQPVEYNKNENNNVWSFKDNDSTCLASDRESKTRNRKSAFDFIKKNFFGKRSKIDENKRKKRENGNFMFRENPTSDDLKEMTLAQTNSKLIAKRKKEKKTEVKRPNRSITGHFSNDRTREASTNDDSAGLSSLPPERGKTRYGNADAEVMERFLEAAVASHRVAPKSPLQKIRRSFRVPRNKDKFENGCRIKNDLDIRVPPYPAASTSNSSNTHNGQEFTYV